MENDLRTIDGKMVCSACGNPSNNVMRLPTNCGKHPDNSSQMSGDTWFKNSAARPIEAAGNVICGERLQFSADWCFWSTT
ncbi:hypothetical protein [Rhizobium halophytocola]|uniref:Uncharacterized protein n=1 Tax=Rhizobium halophytocola TaxID=735519 RepID=A0ABS4DVM4_9HYPH|nr:hypothetical protein [Rhizobium halophytocola]MBP1849710.1 hypothetical protein [Rhizobium halophytocola]